jgi:hypothetical protein
LTVKARRLEHGAVIFPAGLADVELGLGKKALQKVRAHFERARATERLSGDDHALFHERRVATEQQGLHLLAIARGRRSAGYALESSFSYQATLGVAHHGQHGHLAQTVSGTHRYRG